MRLLTLDERTKKIVVVPETLQDLWYLEKIIEKEDIIIGLTSRKVKPEEGQKAFRKTYLVKLKVQEIKYDEFSKILRVNGILLDAKPLEFIDLHSYQGIEINTNEKLTIIKNRLLGFHVKMIKTIVNASSIKPFTIILIDDEQADIAVLETFRFTIKASIKGLKQGKIFIDEKKKLNAFNQILEKLKEMKAKDIIIAGPGFVKQDFADFLKEKGWPYKIILADINNVGITGLNELLTSKETEKIFKNIEIASQRKILDEFLKNIAKGTNLAVYGIENVKKALQYNAVSHVMLTDRFFSENKDEIDELLKVADEQKAIIKVVSYKSDLGKTLASFSDIIALLRFPLVFN